MYIFNFLKIKYSRNSAHPRPRSLAISVRAKMPCNHENEFNFYVF